MAKRRTASNWKTKIKNICPCFVSELQKPEPSKDKCEFPCNIEELKLILLQKERPTRKSIIKAMLKAGVFTKKEIIFALVEIHDTIYKSASRRIEEAMQELRNENYQISRDADKNIKATRLNE